jgi:hypothetical protein
MEGSGKPDRRVLIAGGAALALTLVVGGVLLAGGGSGEAAPAPEECIESWNADRSAIAYGVHNFGTHGYTDARVGRLPATAEPAGDDGLCAVTFPSLTLDQEPIAAGQVLRGDRWLPISTLDGVELTRVAELQAEAAASSNAVLSPEGKLSAE